jgi:GDP-L-fucose synthase
MIGRNILMAAKDCEVINFINLGSSCMYPKSNSKALTEDMLMTGELESTNEGYALAKLLTTKLCQLISKSNRKMLYKTLIPCNIYGEYDNFDPLSAHLLPAIIRKIHHAKVNKLNTVTIWGEGNARREFLYAKDLADAILTAAFDMDQVPTIMNIGVGIDHSINDYYKIVAEILDWNGDFKHDLNMPVGVSRKLNSIQRQIKWGWMPQTPLKIGIKKTYTYFLESSDQ